MTSTMKAPPTRAEVSRKCSSPSAARMNSVCETPCRNPNVVRTCRFISRSGATTPSSAGSVRVTKMPPSCATAIGGVA